MANLIINEQDIQRLRDIAKRENRPIEEIVSQMIENYASHSDNRLVDAPRGDAHSGYRLKLYAQARRYWEATHDAQRLSLTDAQLDEQFWCIDPEGIPRLKSDQDVITLPSDGLLAMVQLAEREGFTAIESDVDYRKILNEDFPKRRFEKGE